MPRQVNSLSSSSSSSSSGPSALCRRRVFPLAVPFMTGHLIASRTSYLGVETTGRTTGRRLARRKFECLPIAKSLYFYYRAMHFSAKRGIAIACRLSVCMSVCLSVTLVNCDHIGWNSSKIISPLVRMGCSLFATPT